MKLDKFPIRMMVHYRFSRSGRLLENMLLNTMAYLFFSGNRASWELNRIRAWNKWKDGCTVKAIASECSVPLFIVNNWIAIWTAYNQAFGGSI